LFWSKKMPATLTTLIDPAAASAFGFAGLGVRMVSPLFRSRPKILTAQLGATCLFAASYALLGQQTATAICLTGAIQTTIALLAGNRPWLSRTGALFIPLAIVIGALTYCGLPTLFAVTACCLNMISRLQTETVRMRGIQLTATPFGAAHDVVVGAWAGLAGAILSFAVAMIAFRRELRDRQIQHGKA
jgi:hypothetical protein